MFCIEFHLQSELSESDEDWSDNEAGSPSSLVSKFKQIQDVLLSVQIVLVYIASLGERIKK